MKITEQDNKGDNPIPPVWDLHDLFPSKDSAALAETLMAVEQGAADFVQKYRGKIARMNGQQLGAAVQAYEAIMEKAERIRAFAFLSGAAHTSDAAWAQDLQERVKTATGALLFFETEINLMKESALLDAVLHPALAPYSAWLRRVRSFKDYQLDESTERYIQQKSSVAQDAWVRLFNMTWADMRFRVQGKELNKTEILDMIRTADNPDVRRDAFAEFGRVLGQHKKTFALIVNTSADLELLDSQWRGFENAGDSTHLKSQIETDDVKMMIKAVRDSHARLSHRYYAWKAKKTGTSRLHPADRSVPVAGLPKEILLWADAQETVLAAYRKFSPELADAAQKFFDKNWIDAAPRPDKDQRAFSHPTVPAAHPYISMQYQGDFNSLHTLAHEVGHGVHQSLSSEQSFLKAAPPLALSEMAAVFGELLVFHEKLGREKDLVVQRAMLANKVERLLQNIVQQASSFVFEQKVHQEFQEKGELSAERISEIWRDTQKESAGPAVNLDVPGAENLWMNLPPASHAPFSAYIFAECLAHTLYDEYKTTTDKAGFVKKYTDFMKSGGTLRPDVILETFGIDTGTPQFWKKSLSVAEGYVDVLMALDQKIELVQKAQKDFKETAQDIAIPPVPPVVKNDRLDPRGPAP